MNNPCIFIHNLCIKAMCAMHDPAYQETTAEYKNNSGMWKTEMVVVVNQVCDTLEDASQAEHKTAIATSIGATPWLASTASKFQEKYAEMVSETAASAPKKAPAPVVEVEERQTKIRKITDAAAQKIKAELSEKKAKSEARQLELVKEAAVGYLREQFGKGKKPKVALHPVRERLSKACRCSQTLPAGDTRADAPATPRTCGPCSARMPPIGRPERVSCAPGHL